MIITFRIILTSSLVILCIGAHHRASVYFDHAVRHYGPEPGNAYSAKELSSMVNVISSKFSSVVVTAPLETDTVPLNGNSSSTTRIPAVVAEHNRAGSKLHSSFQPMEVWIPFRLVLPKRDYSSRSSYTFTTTPAAPNTTFPVAQAMASGGNAIFPGTVTTLLLESQDHTFFRSNSLNYAEAQLSSIRRQLDDSSSSGNNKNKLRLGLVTELKECRNNFVKPELEPTARKILDSVDLVVLRLRVFRKRHGVLVNSSAVHKIFDNEFSYCEGRLTGLKPAVKVVPWAVCADEFNSLETPWMLECWSMMLRWSEENGQREVIMYSAFDTPNAGVYYYPVKGGWWRMRNVADVAISESSFEEKMGKNESKVEVEVGVAPPQKEEKCVEAQKSPEAQKFRLPPGSSAASTATTLLAVICTFLFLLDVGLVYGIVTRRSPIPSCGGWVGRIPGFPVPHRRLLDEDPGRRGATGSSTLQVREPEAEIFM